MQYQRRSHYAVSETVCPKTLAYSLKAPTLHHQENEIRPQRRRNSTSKVESWCGHHNTKTTGCLYMKGKAQLFIAYPHFKSLVTSPVCNCPLSTRQEIRSYPRNPQYPIDANTLEWSDAVNTTITEQSSLISLWTNEKHAKFHTMPRCVDSFLSSMALSLENFAAIPGVYVAQDKVVVHRS